MAKQLNKKTLKKENDKSKEEKMITCLSCDTEDKENKFYKSRNKFINEEYGLCKRCVKLWVNSDIKIDSMDNIMNIFRILDYPFFKEMWEESLSTDDPFQTYLKKINAPKGKFYNMTYKDGQDIHVVGASFFDSDSNLARWGEGYSDIEYAKMNKLVEDYSKLTGKEDFKSIDDFERVAKMKVRVDRVHANNLSKPNEIKQAEETLTAVMKEAGLTSDKMNSTNKASSLGEWIDIFETHDPIAEPSEEFKDVDKIKSYFNEFFLKNLLRLFGKDDSKVSDDFKEIKKKIKNKEKKFGG